MKKLKYEMLFIVLFIAVGIAAVSSNLLINGSTSIAKNPDDFNVYFSNVLVNGTHDLSLVKSETSLVFTGEFSAVGDKKEITYEVTNASKNYDADIDISCTINAVAVERTSQGSNVVDTPLEPSITSFDVCGFDYGAYYNMTWNDWVESDFNDGNFYINQNSMVRTVVGGYDAPVSDFYDDDYHDAKASDYVIADKSYVCD